MTHPIRPTLVVTLAAVAALTVSLRASDPCGVYAIVDRVVLEPNSDEPFTIQIHGAFSFAVPRGTDSRQPYPAGSFGSPQSGDVYGAVQKGYLYYTCEKSRDAACLGEWRDLAALAGKGEVVGFGTRYGRMGRLRPTAEAPATPDVYPLNFGLIRMRANVATSTYRDLVAALQAASRTK